MNSVISETQTKFSKDNHLKTSDNFSPADDLLYEAEYKDDVHTLVHLTSRRATMPIKRRPSSRSPTYDRSLRRLRTDVARYVLGDESQETNYSSASIKENNDIKANSNGPTNKATVAPFPPKIQTERNLSTTTVPSESLPTYAIQNIYSHKDSALPSTGRELMINRISSDNSSLLESSAVVHLEENKSYPFTKNSGLEKNESANTSKSPVTVFPNVIFIILFLLFCLKWGFFLVQAFPLCMVALIILDYLKEYP